jgi:alpha-amylase/alpha-mannosidase (GH57 family)
MHAAGYQWAASDEDVLFASLGETLPVDQVAKDAQRAALLYRPYRHGDGPVLLFRDHDLSDRIGFTYASRPPADAAADFVSRLVELRESLPDDGTPYVVTVILDGENAWEHFPEHAAPFFDALYGALADEPRIATVTATEAADAQRARPLARVVAGSWIYRCLATWVGHPEKNRAWELLAQAREAILAARGAPRWDDPAWRAILAAEGSDWFWWYGGRSRNGLWRRVRRGDSATSCARPMGPRPFRRRRFSTSRSAGSPRAASRRRPDRFVRRSTAGSATISNGASPGTSPPPSA